jgi:hypothetical protein
MQNCWLFHPQSNAKGREGFNFALFRALRGYYFKSMLAIFLVLLTSCAPTKSLSPDEAQSIVVAAWQANQHVVWVLDWPAVPVGGPVTVETWRAGDSVRYEILEAVAPALIGETLVFDGQTAWQYNRFDSDPPAVLDLPRLSPMSDAVAVVDRLIATTPQLAGWEISQTVHGPAQKINLTYANGDQLTLWHDDETKLPVRIVFSMNGQQATLDARDFEPLVSPPSALFTVP